MRSLKFFILILFFNGLIFSQTQVSVSSDSSWATIGDKIKIKIIVKTSRKSDNITVTIGKKDFDITGQGALQQKIVDGFTIYEKNIEIVFFKTGDFNIGPFRIGINQGERTIEERESNTIPIKIKSLLEEGDKDIKPLKGLADIKGNPFYVLKYFVALLLIAAVLLFIFYKLKKNKEQPKIPAIPVLPPLDEFEKRINFLKRKRFIEDGKIKIFFVALTEIYKNFVSRYYDINAEDLTSYEISSILKKREEDSSVLENFNSVFYISDLSKFAKFIPDSNDIKDLYLKIHEIIDILKKKNKGEEENVAL